MDRDATWEEARQKAIEKMEAAIEILRNALWPPDFKAPTLAQFDNALAAGYIMVMRGREQIAALPCPTVM
jgi:hypothetical protein